VRKSTALQRVALFFSVFFLISSVPVGAAPIVPSNIDSGLAAIYADYIQSASRTVPQQIAGEGLDNAANVIRQNAAMDDAGRYNVLIHLSGTRTVDQVAQALTATGRIQVVSKNSRYRQGVVEAWLFIQDLPLVARTKGVRTVAMSIMPIFNVGAVTQQGVVQHRVDQIAGTYDGTGITVGALSDSFNISTKASNGPITIHYAQDIASGDLPGPGNPLGNTTPVSVLDDTQTPTNVNDEGRAMLQFIHDMAPKARLGFATAGSSQQQFADNIRSLAALPGAPRISQDGFKADIIVDDVIFLDEPMFSDGIVAQAVNDVNAAGVHYFSSAGNQPSSQGYASDFRYVDPNSNPAPSLNLSPILGLCQGGFHNFRTDGTVSITQALRRTGSTSTSVASLQMMFQWDDPFDKNIPGTVTSTQTGTFSGTELTYMVPVTAGVPTRVSVTANAGSLYDAIVTILDSTGATVVDHQDTGTDETIYFTPTMTGNYSVILDAFGGTTGDFTIESADNSTPGISTDYNLFFFDGTTGQLRLVTDSHGNIIPYGFTDNVAVNEPYEFVPAISFGAGKDTVKMVICRDSSKAPSPQANRIRYVFFDTTVVPGEYVGYQYPMMYGHATARDAHGVAAYSAFRPYIPESFSSPGPSTIVIDGDGNRMAQPEIRQQPVVAAMDGGNNTFFLNASQDTANDADTFPNFFGTSAAAPNAASVAALVLQAKGGPGSLSIQDMHRIMRSSALPNDLDPYHSQAVIHVNGGTLTLNVNADSSNSSAAYTNGPYDLKVVSASYSGSGSVASITFNSQNANVTGGNVNQVFPGLAFDTRPPASGGLPFTLGTLVGLTSGNIAASFSNQAGSPSVTGQFQTMTLAFTPGTFTSGRSLMFNVDRDEQHTASLSAPATAGGNSADLWGAGVEIPAGTITPGGMAVTGTMADGSTFSGTFRNVIGTGYSPLSGFGFLNAQRAVAYAVGNVAMTVNIAGTGAGFVTSSPIGINCPGTCSADFATGASITLTATASGGSYFAGFSGCDSVSSNQCTINSLTVPITVSATFTAITAPDSPIISGALSGNGQASISYTAPGYDGGSPITSYMATCTPGPFSASGLVSPLVVMGLTNGTAYSCSVTANNAIGASPPSASLSVTPATVPGAPIIGVATAGNGSVRVAFTPPDNGGSAITSYTASCGSHSNSGAGSPIVVSGLTNGLTVSCTVTATNSVGTGGSSDSSNLVTPRAGTKLARDFNGDGKGDLLWENTDGEVAIWTMNGTAAISADEILGAGSGWSVKQLADFDGNGKTDLVWQHTDGSAAIWLMNGTSVSSSAVLLGGGSGWSVMQTPDLNGDGKADILWQHTDGSTAVWLMNGTTETSSAVLVGAGSGWSVTKVADFDGDGNDDLLWTHTDGRVAIWLMNGTTMTSSALLLGAGSGWSVVQTPDLNGDGKADIVWQHTDGSTAVWLMNGTSPSSSALLLGGGSGWSVAKVADFDGDGKADLLWQHTDGSTAIWLMNGTTMTGSAGLIGAGSGWSVKRTADLNGDGKADIVWQHTDGSTAVWLMNGTTTTDSAVLLGAGTGWSVSAVSQ
jgi:FG-GAP-like repeat